MFPSVLPAISRRSFATSSGRTPRYLNVAATSAIVFFKNPWSSPMRRASSYSPTFAPIVSPAFFKPRAIGATIGTPPIASIPAPRTLPVVFITVGATAPIPKPSPAIRTLFLRRASASSLPLSPSRFSVFITSGAPSKKFAMPE